MTATIRERIIAGVVANLTAGLAGVTVSRDRRFDIPVEDLPAVDVSDGGNSRTDDTSCFGCTFYTMNLVLTLRAAADTDAEVGPAVDALVAAVTPIMLADYTQVGLAIDTHAGEQSPLEKVDDDGSSPIGGAELTFPIEFQALSGDLTRQF